jgi:invasion protein IalB
MIAAAFPAWAATNVSPASASLGRHNPVQMAPPKPTAVPRSSEQSQRYAQAAPAPAPQLPAAPPPPPTPQRTEILRFENWTVTCNYYNDGAKKQACAARLQVQQSGTNQILLSWTVLANDSKQIVSEMQTPTGVTIAPGVEMELDKKGKRTLAFESCDPGHCTATAVMDAAFVRDLSAAQSVQIAVHAINGQTLQFDIPAKGFDKVYAQLRTAL